MKYVFFALSGLLVGGLISAWQQKRPLWVRLVFLALAIVFLTAGLREAGR